LHHTGELLAVGHGAHTAWVTPWPQFVPRRVRLLPRITPVLSVLKTVHRSASLDHSGELTVADNGGAAVSTPNSGDRTLFSSSHLISAAQSESNS
jgi:hypothetical protein